MLHLQMLRKRLVETKHLRKMHCSHLQPSFGPRSDQQTSQWLLQHRHVDFDPFAAEPALCYSGIHGGNVRSGEVCRQPLPPQRPEGCGNPESYPRGGPATDRWQCNDHGLLPGHCERSRLAKQSLGRRLGHDSSLMQNDKRFCEGESLARRRSNFFVTQ